MSKPHEPGRSRRILVAEDDDSYRELLEVALRRDGHITLGVGDGTAAAALLATFVPDLLITDIAMPGRDGLALCREVRGEPLRSSLPIIVMSAAEQSHELEQVLNLGMIWYVRKGIRWDHFSRTVTNLLVRSDAMADVP